VHAASGRRHEPLVCINCAAIPANLIESELFGHERGAYTGATRQREGRFALADGGSIFLDEIGEMPLDLQAKLLRVLQEGEIEPVGGSRSRKVDVRIIAATNRNLLQEVQAGRFREDLYYRLNVVPLSLPPLRERREDIAPLAEAFARRYALRIGRSLSPISGESLRALEAHSWPGNVRELQNVVERAVIMSRDGRLQFERFLPDVGERASQPIALEADAGTRVLTELELRRFERDNLVRALNACNWRVAGNGGAAQLLGMNPSTLTSRIKALGIRPAQLQAA